MVRCGGLQFVEPLAGLFPIEGGAALPGGLQGLAVIVGGRARLADVVQADGQVEQVVGVVPFADHGVEIGLLGIGPTALAGIQVAQGEVEGG